MHALRVWRGEERLWVVFWLYGILLPFGFSLVLEVIPAALLGRFLITPQELFACWTILYFILLVPLWRCAKNVTDSIWTPLVRCSVVLLFLYLCKSSLPIFGGQLFTDLSGRKMAVAVCTRNIDYYAQENEKVGNGVNPRRQADIDLCTKKVMDKLR
jgi:hypothetical protein